MKKDFENYLRNHLNKQGTTGDAIMKSVEDSLTPYILEERELRVTQMDVFSRLMRDRIIWAASPIDDHMSSVVQAQLMYLDSVSNKDIIMHVDSPGGSVKSGLSIIDVMNYIKSDVSTINTGMAASMGSVLLSSGTKGKRSSLRFSKVMIHQVSHGYQGNVQDTRIDQLEAEKYNYLLFKLLAENCGKTLDEVLEHARRDKWFDSDDALKFGLIDEIIGVNEHPTMSKLMEGFDDFYKKEILKGI